LREAFIAIDTVLLLAITKPAGLYVADEILAEYCEVLARPELKIRKGFRQQLLQFIRGQAYSVSLTRPLLVTGTPTTTNLWSAPIPPALITW